MPGGADMAKPRVLDDQEIEILKRNGISPEYKSVVFRSEDTINLINHRTRDVITIHQGDKKWTTY